MPQRIPPHCQLELEHYVSDICDRAKLDYDRRSLVAHELLTHLAERWRYWSSQNKTDREALKACLSDFGEIDTVARSLREPFLKRLLTYQSERGNRLVHFLIVSVFSNYALYSLQVFEFGDDPEETIDQLSFAVGTFMNPVIGVLYFATFFKYPRNKWLSVLTWIRHLFLIPSLLSILNITLFPLLIIYLMLNDNIDHPWWGFVLYGITCFFGWIAAAGIYQTLVLDRKRGRNSILHQKN